MSLDDIKLTLVDSWAEAENFRSWLSERRDFLAIDCETTGLNPGKDYIRLAQIGDTQKGWAFSYRDWRGLIKETLEGYQGNQVFHNSLFDTKMLKADGIVVPQKWCQDTMIMCHLKDPAGYKDLKGNAAKYVDRRARAGQNLLKQAFSMHDWDWGSVPIEVPAYWLYSTMDTSLTALLAEALWKDTGGGRYREAYELEMACIHSLREAELAGVTIDEEYRARASAFLQAQLDWLAPQIPCKPTSDAQVRELLQRMGARLTLLTEHGQLSVDKYVLAGLEARFPVAGLIRQYRQKERLLHAYLDKMAEVGQGIGLAVNGVLRASTHPVGARTGRMSVSDPPLQQLPRGRVVRDAIVAREGHRLVMADFAGMEMRGLASDGREPGMLAAFNRGEDIHDFTAAALYGADFTKPMRTICKNAGFAKIYGAGVDKFAATAGIDVGTARTFLENYDQLFPGVKTYMEAVTRKIYERAGGRTGFGWVRLIDGRQIPVEADEAYKGVNYRIQGSCAVVTKRKIVELDAAGLGPYFRLAVHDELQYEVPDDLAADARHVLEAVMPDRTSFPGVVLEVDSDVVQRWGQHYRDDFPKFVDTHDPDWLEEAA